MHLIAPLVAGVRGAEDGFARIFQRGTSTRATWYTDFEATASDSSGADISLDSNGGAEVYVNQLVDVTVLDVNGDIVREFTAGDAAPNVEVISESFTGTSYSGGSTGADKPTTLQAVLDRVKESFGTTNFNVLLGGVSTSMEDAVGGLPTFINVKAAAYGAVGDGVADDTAAINAALAAAGSGGVVFFPHGSYLVSAGITMTTGANIMGTGMWSSIIVFSHATANCLTYGADLAAIGNLFIRDMAIITQTTGSGNLIHVSGAGRKVLVDNCRLAPYSGSAVSAPSSGSDVRVLIRSGEMVKGHTGNPLVSAVFAGADSQFSMVGTQLSLNGGFASSSDALVQVTYGSIVGCQFDLSTNASGTIYGVKAPAVEFPQRPAVVVGCNFWCTGAAGTVNLFQAGTINTVMDVGNDYGTGWTNVHAGSPTAANSSSGVLSALQWAGGATWASGDFGTIPTNIYSQYTIKFTFDFPSGAKVMTWDTANLPPGRRITLTLHNNSGGAVTPTFPVTSTPTAASGPLSNNTAQTFEFMVQVINGSKQITLMNEGQPFTP